MTRTPPAAPPAANPLAYAPAANPLAYAPVARPDRRAFLRNAVAALALATAAAQPSITYAAGLAIPGGSMPIIEVLGSFGTSTLAGDVTAYTNQTGSAGAPGVGPAQQASSCATQIRRVNGAVGNIMAVRFRFDWWLHLAANLGANPPVYAAEAATNVNTAGGPLTIYEASYVPVSGSAMEPQPITFGGAPGFVLQPGTWIWSDWMECALPATGTTIDCRCDVSWGANSNLPQGHLDRPAGDAFDYGSQFFNNLPLPDRAFAAVAGGGYANTAQSFVYRCSAVAIRVAAPLALNPAVAIVGTSIERNQGDHVVGGVNMGDPVSFGIGWAERLCYAAGVPFINCSMSGSRITDFNANHALVLGSLDGCCTHAISKQAINDNQVLTSLAVAQAACQQMWRTMRRYGLKPFAVTGGTETASANGWQAPDDQVPQNPAFFAPGGIEAQLNAWMRTGAGGNTDIVATLDVAKSEMGGDGTSQHFRTDLTPPSYASADGAHASADGTHPYTAIHIQIMTDNLGAFLTGLAA